jgi:hypothetical protein
MWPHDADREHARAGARMLPLFMRQWRAPLIFQAKKYYNSQTKNKIKF